jgi:hypothetical protein
MSQSHFSVADSCLTRFYPNPRLMQPSPPIPASSLVLFSDPRLYLPNGVSAFDFSAKIVNDVYFRMRAARHSDFIILDVITFLLVTGRYDEVCTS